MGCTSLQKKEVILLKTNMVGEVLPGLGQSFFDGMKTDCFHPKHFWEHILWTEEFSAADQSKFLNTHSACQQKPYRTSFDFNLPNNSLTWNWLFNWRHKINWGNKNYPCFLHITSSLRDCILLTIVHRCVRRVLKLKLAGYLSTYFTLETFGWCLFPGQLFISLSSKSEVCIKP